jgi:pimeloyl-ACP methyl ester carboxylesterase
VIGPLRDHGHEVVTPDLPSEDTRLGLEDYADTIERSLGDVDDVVLVPHSLGGLVGPVVAARRPLKALVYVCALVPERGLSFSEQLAGSTERVLLFEGGRMVDDEGRSYWGDREATTSIMYGDLEPGDARWAFEHLRPQAQRSQGEPSPAPPPGLRTESIVGANDRVVSPEASRSRAPGGGAGRDPDRALPDDHAPAAARGRVGAGRRRVARVP